MTASAQTAPVRLGPRSWDLKFGFVARVRLQQIYGRNMTTLTERIAPLLGNVGAAGALPEDMAVTLIWAGESHRAPKLTRDRVRLLYQSMHPVLQQQLATWAVAGFLRAAMQRMVPQVAAMAPPGEDDGDDGAA